MPENERSLALVILSNTLLFGLPNEHESKFERLWVDQFAYTWRKHVAGTVKELKYMMTWVSLIFPGSSIVADLSSKFLALLM